MCLRLQEEDLKALCRSGEVKRKENSLGPDKQGLHFVVDNQLGEDPGYQLQEVVAEVAEAEVRVFEGVRYLKLGSQFLMGYLFRCLPRLVQRRV
jgi:hypothetical protein